MAAHSYFNQVVFTITNYAENIFYYHINSLIFPIIFQTDKPDQY